MTALHPLAGAAEFPNDNPDLHQGARWVCLSPCDPPRALLRATAGSRVEVASPSEMASSPMAAASPVRLVLGPAPFLPAATEPPLTPRPPPPRSYAGPLELDLDRIVLQHRVEDVPPPPDFVFVPFVSSRGRPALTAVPALTIDPRPCRIVDGQEACRRVERGWRVDVAPCVEVGSAGDPARRSRRRGGVFARPARPSSPEDAPAALELAAASA